jgi:hypothetical protein
MADLASTESSQDVAAARSIARKLAAARSEVDDVLSLPEHPIWKREAFFGQMLVTWLRAALAQLLQTLERFAKDILPRDMGGTGALLYMTGEEEAPDGVWAELALSMDLAAGNYLCESDLSSMKRLLRRAPRAFAQWVLGPMLCVRNGVFEELARDHALADAIWEWAVRRASDPKRSYGRFMEEMAQRADLRVKELQEQYAAKQERRAARQLARNQRISGAPVALTAEDLEDMRAPAGNSVYRHEKGLTNRCQNMLERARDAFPDMSPTIKWRKGDTRSHIGKGGQDKAYAYLLECFRDPSRPWLHGARHKLGLPPHEYLAGQGS